MAIPKKLEEVGFNQAIVKMDVEALTRESMIRLFSLTDDAGETLGEYDELYLDKMKTNPGLDPDDSGAASLIKQFVLLEGKILGFLFQQFLSMVKPIQTALELPQLLTQPLELIRKIKEIIDGIKDLINDVITFFTDTLNWFLGLLLGEIMAVNIPIPSLELSILGITIPIPEIDTLGKFGKEPFLEKLTDKVNDLKDNIASARERIKSLTDKINPDIDTYQVAGIGLLVAQLSKLLSVDVELTSEYWIKANQIHEEILLKKDEIIKGKLNDTQTKNYKFVDRTDLLNSYKETLDNNSTEKNYIKVWTGDEDVLLTMADKILELIETEELELEETINNYAMENDEELANDFDDLDVILITYTEELLAIYDEIASTYSDINDTKDNKKLMEDNYRDMLLVAGGIAATEVANTIQELKDEIKVDTKKLGEESPASAWIESMTDLIIGVIKSPIDIIINIISKAVEGILEFIKELPVPTFTLIKEFFADLLGLADPEKMNEVISGFIMDVSGAGEQFLPVIENVVSFLPWLFVEIAKTFITSVVEPLPIPI